MRISRLFPLVAGLLLAGLMFVASPAQAADLCPSDESVLKSSKKDPPYQCAVHSWSSKKSIAAWDTKIWSSDTALGYSVESKCAYRSSSEVSWAPVEAGPTYTATFTNWADGTRHFGTGVIFTTGSVDGDQIKSDNDCATGDGKIKNSITRLTEKVTIDKVEGSQYWGQTLTVKGSVSPSSATGYVALLAYGEPLTYGGKNVAGPIVDGKFSIPWKTTAGLPSAPVVLTAAYPGDTSKCPAAEKSCGWTGGQSQNVTVNMKFTYTNGDDLNSTSSVSSSGSTLMSSPAVAPTDIRQGATISSTRDAGVKVKTANSKMPGKLGLRCPKGSFPLNTEVYGANSTVIEHGKYGSRIKSGKLDSGRVAIQLSCRENGKSVGQFDRVSYGTSSADRMATTRKGGVLFGGPGGDHLKIKQTGGIGFGSQGSDRIVVGAANGVAVGGEGDDRIHSQAAGRTLLVGGSGRDRIVAGGKARVNVVDGQPDRVNCRGTNVKVKADRFDQLSGNCRRV